MEATNKDRLMSESFSVVVLYEDRKTRDRVLDVCRHMEAQVGDEIELKFSWWRFDFLEDPKLAEQAAEAASLAEMFVVSAHPSEGLPATFTQWIETWLPKKGYREGLLVALIGSENDVKEDAASEYLRGIASRARMDYLGKSLLMPHPPSGNMPQPVLRGVEISPPVSNELQIRPPSHWGINE